MTFFTNGVGSDAPPAETTSFMLVVLADAKTSAGAPWLICWASPELGPKLNTTLPRGCAASNFLPSVVTASVSDDAADTLRVPLPPPVGVPPPAPPAEDEPPQP